MAVHSSQVTLLDEALRDSFRSRNSLARMLMLHTSERLPAIAGTGGLRDVVPEVIDYFDSQGKLDELVEGAVAENPGNPLLRHFYETSGSALSLPSNRELQDLIRGDGGFVDPDAMVAWALAAGPRVCRIEITYDRGTGGGTGFLVGPDLVMTNDHVMWPVVLGAEGKTTAQGDRALPSGVVLRFDYKVLSDGTTINSGTVHKLKGSSPSDWLVDRSPPSSVDNVPDPGQRVPNTDELDFALVRLQEEAGRDMVEQIGGKAQRGWITPPPGDSLMSQGSPLFILQHPEQLPLKWAYDPDSVIGYNGNDTRVTYRTNTLKGSSGSPCFDRGFTLVAVHHSGDPAFQHLRNEGIPIPALRSLIRSRGTAPPDWAG